MGKYDRVNRVVPRGDGLCHDCGGTGVMRKTHNLLGCYCKGSDHPLKCSRCDGRGVDKFGMHCGDCDNNHKFMDDIGFTYKGVDLRELLDEDAN